MSVSYSIITRNAKRIALLELANGPVNGLSLGLRRGILDGAERARREGVNAIVIAGSGGTFPAGADIAEFEDGSWTKTPDLGQVVNGLDEISKTTPIVAAIHGTALGGGLELALACNYRVAAPTAKLGLPEVHLGIMPGAQGTQRLPRVAGPAKALNMIMSGVPIPAKDALECKLIDSVAPGKESTMQSVVNAAVEFACNLDASPAKTLPRISQIPPRTDAPLDEAVTKGALKAYSQRGHVSGPKIVEAVQAATTKPFAEGVKVEERLFRELMATNEAASLQHMFFAERNCGKIPNVDVRNARDVKHVGIVGSGTMGCGIAMALLNKGLRVTMCDFPDRCQRGVQEIENTYRRSSAFKTGKMTEEDLKKRMDNLRTSGDVENYADFANCDTVIEAAFESLAVKQGIFTKLDKVTKPGTLLCTNTSYLSIDEIASATKRPEMVMGTHFFSPANVMPLLENVRGSKTSSEAIGIAMKFGKAIGKTTVLAGNKFGFIGNRMFEPYTQQAILMLEEGMTPSQVDGALGPSGFGMAMGPLAVFDLAGNDIGYRIRKESYYPYKPENVKGKRGATWVELADELCNQQRYGQKTGRGWYAYGTGEKSRVGTEDPIVEAMVKNHALKHGIPRRMSSPAEIVERCVLSMVNEGFRILEEGIAIRSSDIDVVWNFGYGFPRFKGGPMFYADHWVGLKNVHAKLVKHWNDQRELPSWHLEPAPLLDKLVRQGKSLRDWERAKGV